jgi:hypothetical protein
MLGNADLWLLARWLLVGGTDYSEDRDAFATNIQAPNESRLEASPAGAHKPPSLTAFRLFSAWRFEFLRCLLRHLDSFEKTVPSTAVLHLSVGAEAPEVALGETSQTGDAAGSMISSKAVLGPINESITRPLELERVGGFEPHKTGTAHSGMRPFSGCRASRMPREISEHIGPGPVSARFR